MTLEGGGKRAGWAPGDPRAREAGRKGAETAKRNREQGKTPAAGAGRGKDKAPRQPGGFAQTARAVSSKTRQRITALIGTGIVLADEAMAKAVATWGEDKLSGDEVKLLTDAVVGTALRYPKIMRRMEQAAVVSEFAAIPTALLLIALPRLVKRGIVPRTLATTVSPLIDEAQAANVAASGAEADYWERVNAEREAELAEEQAAAPAESAPPAESANGVPAEPELVSAATNADAPTPRVIRPPEPAVAAPGQKFRPPPGMG